MTIIIQVNTCGLRSQVHSHHISLWRWFFSPLLTFFTLCLLPITLLSHSAWWQTLCMEEGEEWRKNRNGRCCECSGHACPLCSGVRLALRRIFILFYIHMHNLLSTHNLPISVSQAFFLPCFFSIFQPLFARCVFLYLWVSQGSPSQMSPWVTTSCIDFLPAALIWTHIGVKIVISTHLAANGEMHLLQNIHTRTHSESPCAASMSRHCVVIQHLQFFSSNLCFKMKMSKLSVVVRFLFPPKLN